MLYFSKNLRFLRRTQNISQTTVGEVIEANASVIANYELGRNTPSLENLVKLSNYLGVTLDDFVTVNLEEKGSSLKNIHNIQQNNNGGIGNTNTIIHTESEWQGLHVQLASLQQTIAAQIVTIEMLQKNIAGIDLVSLARQVRHHSLDQLNQYLVKVGAIHCPDLYTHFKTIEQLKPTESVIGQHSSDFLKLLRNAHRHEVLAPNRYELSLIRAEIDRILG